MTGKQALAIQALLTNSTLAAAARQVHVSERTLSRWLADSEFRAALNDAEGELLDAAQRQLLRLQSSAIEVHEDLLSVDTPHGVRLRAAQSVLDALLKLRELRTLEERLAALEERLAHDRSSLEG